MKIKVEIKVESYVLIRIVEHKINEDGSVRWSQGKTCFSFDIPRWNYDKKITQNRVEWVLARFKYFNPKNHYQTNYSYYDKKTGIDLSIKSAYSRVSSCKATLTKWENKLKEYKRNWQPTLLITEIEQDENYINGLEKLAKKRFELQQAQIDLDEELKTKKQNAI